MSLEDPGSASFAGIGGLGDQVRELREVIELPLMNPELFQVGSPVSMSRAALIVKASRYHAAEGRFAVRPSWHGCVALTS